MTRIYLLRHGETEWNLQGDKYCGRTDVPLTKKGQQQAEAAADYLADIPFDAAYTSPLSRASETAAKITERHGIKAVIDERLLEADFGLWEGQTKEEFIAEDPVAWAKWLKNPAIHRAGKTGESGQKIYNRADSFFEEIANRHPFDTLLVLGHNTLNRFFIAGRLGMPLSNYRAIKQFNTGITVIDINGEDTAFVCINSHEHLKKLTVTHS
ncbi:histidine phosphatase family protein [Scopulibacillus cellulosilyticus]|uniref:Histidine phosphatase family protein n=1 Tax=Scopulibacillus cellulosilyticus TaxID=2665665 RepID=A0ABW2Q1M8_9BACL